MSSRDVLPIPDRQHVGLTTYDAKDPDTQFPPIEPLRPPAGAPNVLVVLLDDVGFGAVERLRRPVPDARLSSGSPPSGLQVQPLPHDGAVLADAAGAADRPQPPLGRHGRHHRDRDLGAGLQLGAPEHRGAAGRDAQAQRLLDGAVRQVPRGAGLGDEPDGAVRRTGRPAAAASSTSTASSAARPTSTYPALYEGTTPVEPTEDAGGGLPLHRGPDRQGDRLGAPAEGADARQAVLHVLRARRHARAAPRARRSGRTSTRASSTQGWDALREETLRAPEGARA